MAEKMLKSIKTMPKKMPETTKSESGCCRAKWNLIPLRFALGLMFFAAGLPKLISLIGGGSQIPQFFSGLGIPLAGFFAWVVAIVETLGGIMLILGVMTWWTGLALGIVMVVATLLTSINPMNWGSLTKHLVYIAGLVALMFGSKYFSLTKCKCGDDCSCALCRCKKN